jgi:hypothetical protein
MPVPLAPPITLAHDEQSRLESIVRAHSTPQALAFRCQLILRAAASDCPSNLPVANAWHGNRHTVSRGRHRSLAPGLHGLQDAPRSGRPRRFSPLSASGCDGDGNASTRDVPLCRHPLEPRCSGGCAGAASPLGHESRKHLAHSGRGRPQTPSECLLAQQPRSGLRAQSARHLFPLSPCPALLCARSFGHLPR